MPTNYTGDPTATQAPSAPPGPGIFPELAMPNDGEPLNVASLRQNEKVLADFAAWAASPTAILGNWADPAWFTQNARGQKRFLVDHMGFPSGRLLQLFEHWRGAETQTATGGYSFTSTNLQWTVALVSTGGSGQASVVDPDPTTIPERHLLLTVGTGGSDEVRLIGQPMGIFGANNAWEMEWDVFVGAGTNQFRLAMGIVRPGFPVYGDSGAGIGGVVFKDDGTGSNWQSVTSDGTTLDTVQDSGEAIAASTLFKFRAEWMGAGVADDGVAAMRFYIGPSLVGTFTAHVPTPDAPTSIIAPSFALKRVAGATARSFHVSPVRISYGR